MRSFICNIVVIELCLLISIVIGFPTTDQNIDQDYANTVQQSTTEFKKSKSRLLQPTGGRIDEYQPFASSSTNIFENELLTRISNVIGNNSELSNGCLVDLRKTLVGIEQRQPWAIASK